MPNKSSQLQIRVTAEQKRRLKQLARESSLDLSSWVLSRLLPDEAERFQSLVADLGDADRRRYTLAELADFLRSLPSGAFQRAVSVAPSARIDDETLNYLAAAIDLAARRRGQQPPVWVRRAPVPMTPQFSSTLSSVRLHLLTRAPVAMRRRNIFVDASIDDRI